MAIYPGPQPRPDVNADLESERHRDDMRRAEQAHQRVEVGGTWWTRLKARLGLGKR
jgi:hypothetical protein